MRVFLIGHGYAPVFKVTDGTGHVVFDQPVPFIPVEQNGLTSEGVVKVPDAEPDQLGFAGVFLPTAVDVGGQLASGFPAPLLPRVSLVSYAGNLGLDSGPDQSVYELDTAHLKALPVAPRPLAPGDSITLPGAPRHADLHRLPAVDQPGHHLRPGAGARAAVGHPGHRRAAAVVRRPPPPGVRPGRADARPGGAARSVDVGGLARSDAAGGFETEFAELAGELRRAQDGQAPASRRSRPAG